ncbi:uncharacterized protein [Haliotis asinina]|uniref:uncharacterized protein n=1 Tax=Haliotis asinina TaxID=109174 RepID=UPI0035320B17
MKLLILLYADDRVILAETSDGLQNSLNAFDQYCKKWKLSVNLEKTKVVIFSKGYCKKKYNFTLNGTTIDISNEYIYLGVLFTGNGRFVKAIKRISVQANKAMFTIFKIIRQLDMPIDCQLKLFDNLVKPILLYGAEVWGFENVAMIERVHLKFCKYILNVKQSTPDFMIYGELGRYPISISVKVRIISNWAKMLSCNNKLNTIFYHVMCNLYSVNADFNFPLLSSVKRILQDTGLYYIWLSQSVPSIVWLKNDVHLTLIDQFKQLWWRSAVDSSKGCYYVMYKHSLFLEPYLLQLPYYYRRWLTKFRTSNHRLPIETGRWYGTERCNRTCHLCASSTSVCDELHFLLYCPALNTFRHQFLPQYFCKHPSTEKFVYLMKCDYPPLNCNIAKFIKTGLCSMF